MGKSYDTRSVLYISRKYFDDPEHNQQSVLIFDTDWETRKALDVLLADDELLWESDDWVRSSTGVVIQVRRCARGKNISLREMYTYELSLREEGMDLQPHHLRELRIVRAGKLPETIPEKRERTKREGAKRVTASAPAGYVHVSDVALSMGIEPKQARVALRKIFGDDKPKWGWHFDPKELDGIKEKIREQLG